MTDAYHPDRVCFLLDHSPNISPESFRSLVDELYRLGCLSNADMAALDVEREA